MITLNIVGEFDINIGRDADLWIKADDLRIHVYSDADKVSASIFAFYGDDEISRGVEMLYSEADALKKNA